MMPVDKGWRMRLHEADLPSLIVSLGNDYKLTRNVGCNESDGHRLAAPSEHMLLCKQARWPGEGKFYVLEAQLQLYPTLFTGTITHELPKDLMQGKDRVAHQLQFPDLLIPLTNISRNTVKKLPAHANDGVNRISR